MSNLKSFFKAVRAAKDAGTYINVDQLEYDGTGWREVKHYSKEYLNKPNVAHLGPLVTETVETLMLALAMKGFTHLGDEYIKAFEDMSMMSNREIQRKFLHERAHFYKHMAKKSEADYEKFRRVGNVSHSPRGSPAHSPRGSPSRVTTTPFGTPLRSGERGEQPRLPHTPEIKSPRVTTTPFGTPLKTSSKSNDRRSQGGIRFGSSEVDVVTRSTHSPRGSTHSPRGSTYRGYTTDSPRSPTAAKMINDAFGRN